jgi:SAM-dependent methyltransferase
MTSLIKKGYYVAIGIPLSKVAKRIDNIKLSLNRSGSKVQCYVCKNKMDHFTPFRRGSVDIPEFLWKLELIGSDVDHFWCVHCRAQDRERHLYMYFDRLGFWEKMKGASILHFAPEKHLPSKIQEQKPSQYVMGDLYPSDPKITKIDVTDIPFEANTFDIVFCNHVLEHVPDYHKAMSEIFRVLKPGGTAILQTPFSALLKQNFEDESINTDALRFYFYAQEDHVRLFSQEQFLIGLKHAGFELHIVKQSDLFDAQTSEYYGVNPKEDLIRVMKPSNHTA